MNLTLSIPYSDLIIRGRYLPAERETSDKPAVPEVYEIESVLWFGRQLVDIIDLPTLNEIERRKLDEIRAEIERAKEESAA